MKVDPYDPTFPTYSDGQGIPLRLHIAAMMAQGLSANPETLKYAGETIAVVALNQADALIQLYNETTP